MLEANAENEYCFIYRSSGNFIYVILKISHEYYIWWFLYIKTFITCQVVRVYSAYKQHNNGNDNGNKTDNSYNNDESIITWPENFKSNINYQWRSSSSWSSTTAQYSKVSHRISIHGSLFPTSLLLEITLDVVNQSRLWSVILSPYLSNWSEICKDPGPCCECQNIPWTYS
jgi:hypothetical protein